MMEPDTKTQEVDNYAWMISFSAAMVPFVAFCHGHSRGMTGRVVESVCRSRIGPAGLLLLPFCTLAMEKSVYDTVQAAQGINPNTVPADRGGFPSGGGQLPSFSIISVQETSLFKLPFLKRRGTVAEN
jgi:hypothetical protein